MRDCKVCPIFDICDTSMGEDSCAKALAVYRIALVIAENLRAAMPAGRGVNGVFN